MKRVVILLALFMLNACVTRSDLQLSGPVTPGNFTGDGVRIGLVADSQLQTRTNYAEVWGYRHPLADRAVDVSIRPPALDWAARALLQSHLDTLRAQQARAIFYLGDGANNGCLDEFAAGFGAAGQAPVGKSDEGLLALLDRFRAESGIPVYFVLGNHDLLGAGSTGDTLLRSDFCSDPAGRNRPLSKAEVIRFADLFNRPNAALAPDWNYVSSYVPGGTEAQCGTDVRRQHYKWGCYLAARVDYSGAGPLVRFMLLDTNDWSAVFRPRIGKFEQLGLWGAMSFGSDDSGVLSQTDWFTRHAGDPIPMRVALMHYDVRSLQKRVFGVTLSRLSQRFMDLFSVPGDPRVPRQKSAVAISAHTHSKEHSAEGRRFHVGCGAAGCEPEQIVELVELNIGSTTDFSNYSTLVELRPPAGAQGETRYQRVDTVASNCGSVYDELRAFTFPNTFRGSNQGWSAIGVDPRRRYNYRDFKLPELANLWANLEAYAGTDTRKAACVGRAASELEFTGRFPG